MAETPMVEAVARAIRKAGYGSERGWRYEVHEAVAAIQAMREPSEAMVDALDRVPGGWGVGAWSVGIDAALAAPDAGRET